MSQKIFIILAKAGYCIHCKNFEPIFTTAKNICKFNDFLKNHDIKFDEYDMADNTIRNTFEINHHKIMDQIKGYPTVFINIRDTSNAKNIINDYLEIEHVVANHQMDKDEDKQKEEAAKRFLENIVNGIKTLNSDSKTTYIQTGKGTGTGTGTGMGIRQTQKGGSQINEMYKLKYLKYKSKYHELKNKLNVI